MSLTANLFWPGPARRGSFLSIKQKQKPQSSNDLEVYTVCGCVAAVIRHSKCYLVFGLTYSLVSNYTHTYIAYIYIQIFSVRGNQFERLLYASRLLVSHHMLPANELQSRKQNTAYPHNYSTSISPPNVVCRYFQVTLNQYLF